MGQQGFWDWEGRQEKLSEQKDLFPPLNRLIPGEEFRGVLDTIHQMPRKSQAGRKPPDVILMFKMLILQPLGCRQ